MACELTTVQESACTSGIGKVRNPTQLLQIIAQLLCDESGGGSSPLVYRALMNQSGTNAPVPTILENTIGNIVWSYNSVGDYLGKLNGLDGQFQRNKTVIEGGRSVADVENAMLMRTYVPEEGYIEITTWDISTWASGSGSPSHLNDVLGSMIGDTGSGTYLEIKVYP